MLQDKPRFNGFIAELKKSVKGSLERIKTEVETNKIKKNSTILSKCGVNSEKYKNLLKSNKCTGEVYNILQNYKMESMRNESN